MKFALSRAAFAISCCAYLILSNGCGGPKIVKVSGQVLIDGQPLQHGFVQIAPEGYRAASAKIGPDGRFTLTTTEDNDGVVMGRHPAAVIGTQTINAGSQWWHAPKKYADIATSGLEVEITGATQNLVIELTWDGGKPFIEYFNKE